MVEETLDLKMPDGISDSVLFKADGGKRLPGLIFLTDIGGIRPSQIDKAKRIADNGYAVLLPNIFYRTGPVPVLPARGTVSDDKRMERIDAIRAPLTPDAILRDMAEYVDAFIATGAVDDGPIGVVGYCFSGKMALAAAAVRPERVGVGASFHGGHLVTDQPTSPHLLLPKVKARLYFGHAVKDQSMPEEAIVTLDEALGAWGGHYQSEVYEGAYHSWTEPDSPVFNPAQAERAYEKLMENLKTLR